VNIIFIVAGCR